MKNEAQVNVRETQIDAPVLGNSIVFENYSFLR